MNKYGNLRLAGSHPLNKVRVRWTKELGWWIIFAVGVIVWAKAQGA